MKLLSHNKNQNVYFPFDKDAPLYVCDVGYHKTPPLHSYGPAVRPYYLLHLIETGKGKMIRNGQSTPLEKGQAFLICPDEVTTYQADESEPWEYYWISFYGSYSKAIVEQTVNGLFFPYRQSGLLALKNAIEQENTDTVDALNTLFGVLASIKNISQNAKENPIETSLKYLESNYFRSIHIEDVAKTLGYSRAHFTTLFASATGVSPYRYLLNIRLEKAKDFLKNSSLSIEEIAFSVGFSSLVRFSELFKKHVGVSPTRYRRNN